MKFIQKNWKNLTILILLIICTISTCTCKRIQRDCGVVMVGKTSDTIRIHTIDTVYIEHIATIPSYQPKPIKVVAPKQIPDGTINKVNVDYYSKKVYSDSVKLKDSVGNDVGIVEINDTISENKILDRAIKYRLRFPKIIIKDSITITNTITQEAKPKNRYYIGAEVLGNSEDIVNGAMIKLLMQNKKKSMFSLSIGGITQGNVLKPEFGIGYYKRL